MRRFKLSEGMWAGDLSDLVQPLISIDEFQSKIDDDTIAIGFYVHDKDAADDLNRFIQKSPVSIVDCDVSPAPDQRGYYIVFVELSFNERIVANIGSILEEISPLVGVENWQMKVRNTDGLLPYDGDKLFGVLRLNQIRDKMSSISKQITDFKNKKSK